MNELATQLTELPVTVENILSPVTEDFVLARIQQSTELTGEIIDDLHLQNLIDYHGDFTQIRCPKTGRVLGEHKRDYLSRCFKTMEEEYAVELLMRENIARPCVHWIKDDGVSLEKLILSDPAGYFVYAAGYVLSQFSPTSSVQLKYHLVKSPDIRHEAYKEFKLAEWQWIDQKAAAFKLVAEVDEITLIRVNEVLRRWLAFFDSCKLPENLTPFKALVQHREDNDVLIAAAENIERFERLVQHAFRAALLKLNRNHEIDPKTDYNRLYRFKATYGGHGNFFAQRKPARMSDAEHLFNMISTDLAEAGVTDMSIRAMENKVVHVTSKGTMITLDKGQTLAHVYAPGQKIKLKLKVKEKGV